MKIYFSRRVLYSLIFCCIVLFASGCSDIIYFHKEYNKPSINYKWGSVNGLIIGKWNNRTLGAPYEVCVVINSETLLNAVVSLDDIEIHDVDAGESKLLDKGPVSKQIERNNDGTNKVIFCFGPYELDYKRYRVTCNLSIKSENEEISEKIVLDFEMEYKEVEGSFWDFLTV